MITIKMEKKNEDGKTIIKDVPENIASTYEKIGWKIVEKKMETKPLFNKPNKEDE